MINTSQQVGGAIGIALLNTIAASATTTFVAANATNAASPQLLQLEAMVHGFTTAVWWAVAILAAAAALTYLLVDARTQSEEPGFNEDDELTGEGDAVPVIAH